MTTLQKQPVYTPDDATFADEVAEKLGYKVLQQSYGGDVKVRNVFSELGIQTYNIKDIQKYKDAKVDKNNRLANEGVLWTVFMCVPFMLTVASIAIPFFPNLPFPRLLPVVFTPFLFIGFLSVLQKAKNAPKTIWQWRQYDLTSYEGEVPEFALQTALDIKHKLPEAEFYIDELREIRDPFLYMRYKGEQYYLEYWNEPGFTKKLRKETNVASTSE